jgi:hypothetical protein
LQVSSDGQQVVLEPLAEEEGGLWVAAEDTPEVVVPTYQVLKVKGCALQPACHLTIDG